MLLPLGCAGDAGFRMNAASRNEPLRFVGPETLDLIVDGQTTAEWVRSRLGQPTTMRALDDGVSTLWRYEYERIENPDGVAYRLLEPDRPRRIARAIHFEFTSAVVQRWWIE